ncbi:MAG: hypothetical protein AAGN35_01615 [Bacteroidota bacterium]
MSSSLENRFEYLREERLKDLEKKGQDVPLEFEYVDEEAVAREKRRRLIRRELGLFLLSALASTGLGFILWVNFADQLVGLAFDPGNWAPPDEAHFPVVGKINEGFWRETGGALLTIAVCLLGIYLTRIVNWIVSVKLVKAMKEEE